MFQINESRLNEVFSRFSSLKVLVIGDLMLDKYVFGGCERISPEAPVPIVLVKRTESRLGGAGLVVRNLNALGIKDISICGIVGDDVEGERVKELLNEYCSDVRDVVVSSLVPTTVKTRVIANNQQVVRYDREKILATTDPFMTWSKRLQHKIAEFDCVIVSDYGKGVFNILVSEELQEAKKLYGFGVKKRPLILDPHPRNYSLVPSVGFSVAKPNRLETESATGVKIDSLEAGKEAAMKLLMKWNLDVSLVTLGEDGLVTVEQDTEEVNTKRFIEEHFPSEALSVFDVTGAGDAVTAVFSAVLGVGGTTKEAAYIANAAGSLVVSEVGTVPVDCQRLRDELIVYSIL